MTLINLMTWTRGKLAYAAQHRLSVLIPVRNEQETLEACISAIERSDVPVEEIIVYDDQSTDRTPQILSNLSQRYAAIKIVTGGELPQGWVGKSHACHHLAEAATGDVLLFVDADTVLQPSGIRRLLSILSPVDSRPADVVTAVPRQLMQGTLQRLLMPLLILTYTGWLPLWLIGNSRNHRFLAANGQLLMMRRTAYKKVGGYASVADQIVEDMAICRRAKQKGARVVFVDGYEIAHCRMYRTAFDLWQGFSKNIYEGVGNNPISLIFVLGLYALAFVWPYASLAVLAGTDLWSL